RAPSSSGPAVGGWWVACWRVSLAACSRRASPMVGALQALLGGEAVDEGEDVLAAPAGAATEANRGQLALAGPAPHEALADAEHLGGLAEGEQLGGYGLPWRGGARHEIISLRTRWCVGGKGDDRSVRDDRPLSGAMTGLPSRSRPPS